MRHSAPKGARHMDPQQQGTRGGCRRAGRAAAFATGLGVSSGSKASLVLPMRVLEFPDPARHPQGKPGSEQQPKNRWPGHREKGK